MKKLIPLIIGVLILSAFGGTVYFLYSKSQAVPLVYETGVAFETDIVKKTVATGAIVPRKEIEIKPQISGVIDKLFVDAGEQVKAGDLIARIKIIPNMVSLNRAESGLKVARINFQNSKRELTRFKNLFDKKLISEAEFNRYQLEFQLRRQELDEADSNVQLLKEGASKNGGKVSNEVRATVSGMIIEVPVKEGETVTEANNFNAGTTLAMIADMTDMIFQGRVDESEVGKIKEGMPLDIKVGAIDDTRFSGKLEYISPKGQQVEGAIQFEIKAAVKLKESTFIRANYSANADVVLDRRDKVMAIKESWLQFEEEKPYVEVEVSPQIFERRDIKLGLSDGINIEVLEGINKASKVKKPEESREMGAPPSH